MKVSYGYRNSSGSPRPPLIAAIGVFDGIHIGHKRVIKKVLSYRGARGERAVITFDPHPLTVLSTQRTPPRIMSLEHRISAIERLGLDSVIVIKFSDFIAMMSPEDFVRTVLTELGAKKIYVGSNFHFGRGKSGNVERLKEIAAKYGIEVDVVRPVKSGRRVVSSTWLRSLISKGDLRSAERLLRRPVSVYGTVVKGDERGRRLGIPTANIDPHQEVIPPAGVYAVKVDVNGILYNGVLNIGYRPTFYGRGRNTRREPVIEVHVMGFTGDLYGRTIEIFFLKRIRGEKHFGNERDLVARVTKDIDDARRIIAAKKQAISRIQRYKLTAGKRSKEQA